jgi:hypothetical protein
MKLVNATTPLHQQRRNPDGTFYPFDAFCLNYTYSFPFMQQRTDIRVVMAPTYDHAVLTLSSYSNSTGSGGFYLQMDNKTGGYSAGLTTEAFNWQGQLLGQKSSSSNYHIIPFVLAFSMKMQNVTEAKTGFVLRNPDGSFYRNDSFKMQWEANFTFSDVRKDIRINVTSFDPESLGTVNVTTGRLERNGTFLYNVGNSSAYQPFNITYRFQAFNYHNDSLTLRSLKEPYAVVKYSPLFSCFTYMLYNSKNSTAYERPFVTLVRYDGNDPGYSYGGNLNTAGFRQGNSTGERAVVNNFTYVSSAYEPTILSAGPTFIVTNSSHDLPVTWLNATSRPQVFKWTARIQRFLFDSSAQSLDGLLAENYTYIEVNMTARSVNFAGGSSGLFVTSYWYQPTVWNGQLEFRAYDSNGDIDPATNITLTVYNSSPLDSLLESQFNATFGHDPRAFSCFKKDLYATPPTMRFSRTGELPLLVNMTDIGVPIYLVQVSHGGALVSYSADESGLTMTNASVFSNSTIPITGYVLPSSGSSGAGLSQVVVPVRAGLAGPTSFWVLVKQGNTATFVGQIEMAQLQGTYAWYFGNTTEIPINFEGGGISLLSVAQTGNSLSAVLMANLKSGGITEVETYLNGTLIDTETLSSPSLIGDLSGGGYFGPFDVSVPAAGGGDVTAKISNSWGATTTLRVGAAQPAPPADYSHVMNEARSVLVVLFALWICVLLLERYARY